jgi:glucoamylase
LRHDAVNEVLSLEAVPKAAGGQGIGVRKNVSMLRTKSGVIGVSCVALALAIALPAAAQEFFGDHNPTIVSTGPASNGPGMASPWSNAMKQGIGSSYEAYKDFKYSDTSATGKVSKVWFSLAQGIITETMFGRIDQAQIRELKFAVTGQDASGGWTAFEGADTTSHIAYIHTDAAGRPLSPAYRVTTTDKQGRFVIIKDVLTDPDHQSLTLRVTIKALKGPVTPYLILDPSVSNTSGDDEGRANVDALTAWQGKAAISLRSNLPFKKATVGYTGVSDSIAELTKSQALGTLNSTLKDGKGNILMVAQLATVTKAATQDFALGFGGSADAARAEASATLKTGYAKVLAKFNADWDGYLA